MVREALLIVEPTAEAAVQTTTRAEVRTVTLTKMHQELTAILNLNALNLRIVTMKKLHLLPNAEAVPQRTRKSINRTPATPRMRSRANPSRHNRMQEVTLKARPLRAK